MFEHLSKIRARGRCGKRSPAFSHSLSRHQILCDRQRADTALPIRNVRRSLLVMWHPSFFSAFENARLGSLCASRSTMLAFPRMQGVTTEKREKGCWNISLAFNCSIGLRHPYQILSTKKPQRRFSAACLFGGRSRIRTLSKTSDPEENLATKKPQRTFSAACLFGGERGIRTLDKAFDPILP